jgi:hypothetical protein
MDSANVRPEGLGACATIRRWRGFGSHFAADVSHGRRPPGREQGVFVKLPLLESRHEVLISVVADALAAVNAWPRYDYVDAKLDHEHAMAIEDALADLPPELAYSQGGHNPQSLLVATVPGLAGQQVVRADIERFVSVIALAAEAERSFWPSPVEQRDLVLKPADVLGVLGSNVSAHDITRLGVLLNIERPVSFSGQAEGQWSLRVDISEIRRYHGVSDISDFIARRPQPPSPRGFLAHTPQPSIFVVMPFKTPWANNVYDTIGQACREVAKTISGLTWQRADDIASPGRVTDQVVISILNADLIIAEVTGNNPNVMFELGYADAAKKPIVVLNQAVDDSPFDIKDWRQINYSSDKLAAARDELVSFIRGGLALHTR